ncbi:hypothetical protein GP2143_16321 [marine gamma proteobacterium HTCC2143]|jgi:uncharacterized membrane protein YgdD (TMEM256/DUF423 family)|uniref:DUF423 domain-containing protein n=1 Tax=marine gamma proteobacterium HTCC2143 TaxID=247633 RepID=A0Y9N4_9GAMM|nr:hypothetical protein GP2143_16321 [marine gamma proteobacterium HTCC2143]
MAKLFLVVAAMSGLMAVIIGAFGAHGLKDRVAEDLLVIYQTGVQYHFYHTFALLAVSLLLLRYPQLGLLNWSGGFFIIGTLIFSGSLYVMALTGFRWLGAITPIGGVVLIIGWLMLVAAAYKGVGE